MIRAFCDANVLFAAAISPDGRSSALFAGLRDAFRLLGSPHVVEEARRNVVARYPEAAARLDEVIGKLELCPEGPPQLVAWARDQRLPEGDAPVLAAAVHAGASALVTGDRKHFGHLFGRALRGVEVITLKDAVARFL